MMQDASADWHDFATMIGGASGARTGRLFVAVSLNANRIAGHAGLHASAGQTLVLFITPLIANDRVKRGLAGWRRDSLADRQADGAGHQG